MKIYSYNFRLLLSLLAYVGVTLFLATILSSCDSDDDSEDIIGDWTKASDFSGVARSGAVSFLINDQAYVGTGYDGKTRLTDIWMYDASKDSWVKKADFPGTARSAAVGFSANGKGYVGLGYDGYNNLKDFWEYDPTTNTWTQLADFPGSARYGALALTIDDKGYVGAGYDGNYLKDFWQFDPATKQWTEKTGLGGAKRLNAWTFVQNGKAYVGGGVNNNLYNDDILVYDPATDTWTKMLSLNETDREDTDYPSARASAITFIINNKVYLVGGTNGANLSDVWEYDVTSDTWTSKNAFEGYTREGAVGFSIGNYGYLTTGNSGASSRFDDLWRFDPTVDNE